MSPDGAKSPTKALMMLLAAGALVESLGGAYDGTVKFTPPKQSEPSEPNAKCGKKRTRRANNHKGYGKARLMGNE
jgi:hypothetical protein